MSKISSATASSVSSVKNSKKTSESKDVQKTINTKDSVNISKESKDSSSKSSAASSQKSDSKIGSNNGSGNVPGFSGSQDSKGSNFGNKTTTFDSYKMLFTSADHKSTLNKNKFTSESENKKLPDFSDKPSISMKEGEAQEAEQNEDKSFVEKMRDGIDSIVDKGKEVVDGVKEKGKEVIDDVKEKGKEVIDDIKEKGKEVIDDIKEKGKEVIDDIKETGQKINDLLKDQKTVSASDKDDTVNVSQTKDGKLVVNINGEEKTYTKEEAEKLVFDLGKGNDTFTADKSVTYGLNVNGRDGDNDIKTGLGNDNVKVGNGNNKVTTGWGDDTIKAGNGDNKLYGEGGNDRITAGNGDNKIVGAAGVDTILTGKGNNQIYSGNESDTIVNQEYECIDDIKDSKTAKMLKENTEYTDLLEERYNNADPRVRALYDKYEKDIKLSDIDTQDTARYNSFWGDITVNMTEDSKPRPSAGTTYYHEVGHLMDDKLKLFGSVSGNEAFTNALHKDVDDYVNKYMEEHPDIKSKEDAYAAIGQMMNGFDADKYRGVSDVYGGLTENQAKGRWGHSNDYWEGSKTAVNKEAFANMFEVSMGGDPEALKHMKEMFPTAYEEFINMVEAGT